MNKDNIKKAAELSWELRILLEEIHEDIRPDHIGLADIAKGLATSARELESTLDDMRESMR